MPLTPGTRLGPYEVVGSLGAGGMGEVYRARDTQLKRDVALKVLPAEVSADPGRLARFQREAELLAALNHPHIAQIHGLVQDAGTPAIVMELVEGQTLADRIARGAVPLDEALPIAEQLADALEYAHERGIIHRDLKPANIKLTPDGAVKVLDFGLAKALAADGGASATAGALADSPTMTSPVRPRPDYGAAGTEIGVILGTAAYMAPEQARGAAADKRADIWAFGAVLFEVLTGRPCFAGVTVTDVLAAVVRAEPDWPALPPGTPPRVGELLRRCLAKDRRQRLRDIGDARLEIESLQDELRWIAETGAVPASEPRSQGRRQKVLLLALAASVLALAAQSALTLSGVWPRSHASPTLRLRVSSVHPAGNEVGEPAISPDGRRLAYRARGADGVPRVWVRDLEDGALQPLPGSEEGFGPFWSPDSQEVGFGTRNGLRRTSAQGGPIERITRTPSNGASWGAGGTIVYAGHNLFGVSATGGEPFPVQKGFDEDWELLSPSFLPDGRRFLFTAKQGTESAETSRQGIYLGSLDSREPQRLLPDLSSAVYVPPGYLFFVREGQLTAASFDAATGRLGSGRPVALPEPVAIDPSFYVAGISASSNGTVAVRPPPVWPMRRLDSVFRSELRLVSRDGTTDTTAGGVHPYTYRMALEASGRRAVAATADLRTGLSTLWLVDMGSGTRRPLGRAAEWNGSPVWSPDGTRVACACQPKGGLDDLCINDLPTGETRTLFTTRTVWESPLAWSRDGEWLLFLRADDFGVSLPGLYAYSFRSGQAREVVDDVLGWAGASFSPDSHFVAYTKLTSGRREVYVAAFPEGTRETPVTTDGASVLGWGEREGRGEILAATLSGDIVAYPVSVAGAAIRVGKSSVLLSNVGSDAVYARATPDHSRILIRVDPDAQKDKGEIVLLFGWAEMLKVSVPAR